MAEQRNLKLDLFALALLGIVVFLALALVTYSPFDPVREPVAPFNAVYQPDELVYPANAKTQNACGRLGATVADVLLTTLGIGAYYLVVSLAVLDVMLLRRRKITMPWLRGLSWLASLVAITAIAALLVPHLSAGPVIGSGGYLGTLAGGMLQMHFATFGSVVLAASVLVCGLLLSTDYAIVGVARKTAVVALAPLTVIRRRREKAAARPTEAKPDEAESLPVRVGGKKADTIEAAAVSETPAEPATPDNTEAEPDEAPPPVIRKKKPKKKKSSDSQRAPYFLRRKKGQLDREKVMSQLDDAVSQDAADYELPGVNLLLEGDDICFEEQEAEVRRKAKVLEKTFAEFGFNVKVVEIETGPVIAQYEVQLEAGLRLSKITGLADDLAIALRVPSVRIVAPIPGKNTVGIEVPNETRQVVRLREVMEDAAGKTQKMHIPIFLGKDVSGNALTVDLATLPHLLIAGRTGTGKSVCLNAIIASILMTKRPDEVRMLMIDPKMVELSGYGRLPHLMHPVVTDMRKAEAILAWAVEKMEERYQLLAKAGVRHISSYNQLDEEELIDRIQPESDEERAAIPLHLPFIVIVADEMADLMMTAGKEVEQHIIRLAQKSRAVGIHLILATQKPTVDVITGLIKSNLPARIAFQVASRTDSRVVLDEMGADKLLGNGDMLFLWPGTSTLLRGQGTYLGDDEINAVTKVASRGEQNFVQELVTLKVEDIAATEPEKLRNRDELYEQAVDVVIREGRGSVSLLQRSLGIGYGRAARLIDFMAEDGIVGEYAGSQARDVLISVTDWRAMQGGGQDEEDDGDNAADAQETRPRKRSKKVTVPFDEDDEHRGEREDWSDDDFDEEPYEDDFADGEEDEYEEHLEAERA